jgi:dolichol-phosphate mannosyltransferase
MKNPKILVIIPTYNELENIRKLIPTILNQNDFIDILIIDDNSPDHTGKYVEDKSFVEPRIKIIKRPYKMGLGTAYITGFKYAIDHNYDLVFEMDADFSHDPKEIPNFLNAIKDADLVLGSRYINGVRVLNWPMRRLLLSYFASIYTRIITGLPVHDTTGGFKCFKIDVLKAIDLDKVRSNGYSFQIEMTYKAYKKNFRIKEIPIVFTDRAKGTSKMSKKIVLEAVFMVWKLRIRSILGIL